MTYFSSWIWNQSKRIWERSQTLRQWSQQWPTQGGAGYFKVDNILQAGGQYWDWNQEDLHVRPSPKWDTHLASGCGHPDRGHLPTHGECTQMEGAFPTQLPKAHGNHLESLEHDCSSWGGWASPLPKSCRVKESMQFNNENWAPLLTRRSEICFVLFCRKYRVYMNWIVSMNVYFPCVGSRLEPQGLITHIPNFNESFFSRKWAHQCRF